MTATSSEPPSPRNAAVPGAAAYVQDTVVPVCDTANDRPATFSVARRTVVLLLAVTAYSIIASPLPDAGVWTVTQPSFVETVHVHEFAVWTATVPVPPVLPKPADVDDNANTQPGGVRSLSFVQDEADHAAGARATRTADVQKRRAPTASVSRTWRHVHDYPVITRIVDSRFT